MYHRVDMDICKDPFQLDLIYLMDYFVLSGL